MNLDQWQERLQEQFKVLCEVRKDTPQKNPVYALEHGLNDFDLERLKGSIRTHIATSEPRDRHWLSWVVYAAEIGYGYDGQEYWQTFNLNTDGWARFDSRYRSWIRRCFLKFRDEFNGAVPTGPWAEWFVNICWPIRHAILPHYLQHQLAKTLFDMRLFFRGEYFESPLLLGNFIATHCRSGSKRFLELLEDPMLVGQISVALLLQGHKISEDLLLKETQSRIVADLGREQMEREWLESAQIQAKTTYEGLRRRSTIGGLADRERAPRSTEEILRVENTPSLFLYPRSSRIEWDVKLELQDLTSLATRIPILRPVIAGNYCTVTGTNGSPQVRGMFLRPGPHRFTLIKWPSSKEVLLKFDNAPAELNAFLRMDHLLPAGDVHLFKMSAENIGHEVRGKNVRPGQKYVVLSASPIKHDGVIFKQFQLCCEGISSALIEAPREITNRFEEAMKAIGLCCTKSLRARPVGLPAKEWDEEGYGLWIAGDKIRIGLKADYELQGLQIKINESLPSFFPITVSGGELVLLDFSPLPIGENLVEVTAVAKKPPHEDTVGYLSIVVREPQVWDIKTAMQGALRGFVDPEMPSLENIWGGNINLDLYGPAGRPVKCKFRLLDMMDGKVIKEKPIHGLALPIYNQQWKSEFSSKIKEDPHMQESYDIANIGEIIFDAEEVGQFKVTGERRSTPLRWAVQTCGHHKRLRYINETEEGKVEVTRFGFLLPDNPIRITKITSEQTLEYTDGGLFLVAGLDGYRDTIVMSPLGRTLELADMKICPQLHTAYRGNPGIESLITLYDLWARSRTSGNFFAGLWKRQVVKTITSEIGSNIGGERWGRAEKEYLRKDDEASLASLRACISDKAEERYIVAALEKDAKRLSGLPMKEREALIGGLFQHHIRGLERSLSPARPSSEGVVIKMASPAMLPGFVLRLASAPNTLLTWQKDCFPAYMGYLREAPVIARGGRYLVLAVERHCPAVFDREGWGHRGWRWS